MSISVEEAPLSDNNLLTLKSTLLNPNAAEFVPTALTSSAGIANSADSSSRLATSPSATSGKSVLDRLESSVSNNSDDEDHKYWQSRLPDDITPDFKVMVSDDSPEINNLSFSSLSLNNANETSRVPVSPASPFAVKGNQGLSSHHISGNSFASRVRYPVSYGLDSSVATFRDSPSKSWEKRSVNNNLLVADSREGAQYNGKLRDGFVADFLHEQPYLGYKDIHALQFLAAQFPLFSAETLAEVYYAKGGDLNLSIKILTQLEIDGGVNESLSSKAMSAPNLSVVDFPSLSAGDSPTGMAKLSAEGFQHSVNSYSSYKDHMLLMKSSSSIPTKGAADFASAVMKMAPQDSGMWKYDRNGSPNANVGPSRSSHGLASSYSSGHDRGPFGDWTQPQASSRSAETGETVANMYSEMWEEARDHARLCNAYFEQARLAYLIGNKALAKELDIKGQLHSLQMKAAHEKAQESIFCRRSPVSPAVQTNGRGHERIIDLHGLHVSEAIHVLKCELAALRNVARSADRRLQAYICVGTGQHTKGSRTPARLAVQQYLLEEEGLLYSEPRPGLLRVVIY